MQDDLSKTSGLRRLFMFALLLYKPNKKNPHFLWGCLLFWFKIFIFVFSCAFTESDTQIHTNTNKNHSPFSISPIIIVFFLTFLEKYLFKYGTSRCTKWKKTRTWTDAIPSIPILATLGSLDNAPKGGCQISQYWLAFNFFFDVAEKSQNCTLTKSGLFLDSATPLQMRSFALPKVQNKSIQNVFFCSTFETQWWDAHTPPRNSSFIFMFCSFSLFSEPLFSDVCTRGILIFVFLPFFCERCAHSSFKASFPPPSG